MVCYCGDVMTSVEFRWITWRCRAVASGNGLLINIIKNASGLGWHRGWRIHIAKTAPWTISFRLILNFFSDPLLDGLNFLIDFVKSRRLIGEFLL